MSANYNLKPWFFSGHVTISGTPNFIPDNSDLSNGVVVLNPSGSLDSIFIGPSGGQYFQLSPSAGTRIPVSTPSLIWAYVGNSGIVDLQWYGN